MKRLFLICNFLLSAAALDAAALEPLKTVKDGISLEVSHTEQDGKNLMKATFTNGSTFPMCSGSLLWKNVFYAKLTDREDNELLPFEEWAILNVQKSSRQYQHPRSHTAFQITPGESVNFEFFLEDAYPAEAIEKGVKLEISWETRYFGTDVDFDGKAYRFPPDWKTSVTVPMADIGLGMAPGKEAEKAKPAATELVTGETPQAGREQPTMKPDENTNKWPLIIALVFLLLALFAWLRQRQRSGTSRQ